MTLIPFNLILHNKQEIPVVINNLFFQTQCSCLLTLKEGEVSLLHVSTKPDRVPSISNTPSNVCGMPIEYMHYGVPSHGMAVRYGKKECEYSNIL